MLPKDIENLILDYTAQLKHTELLDRVHAQMLINNFLYSLPRRVRFVSYWLPFP